MRLLLLTLLVVAVRTRADDSEELTNREIADVDYYDQRDHDMVVARAFGPGSLGGVRSLLLFLSLTVCSSERRDGRIRW